jgi:hypothetical protein
MKTIFSLTEKTYLIFGKTLNRFPKLYFLSLHVCLISDYPNPAIVGRSKPGGTGIQHHSSVGIMSAPESSDIRPSSPDAGIIWPESGHGQKPAEILPDLTGSGH